MDLELYFSDTSNEKTELRSFKLQKTGEQIFLKHKVALQVFEAAKQH